MKKNIFILFIILTIKSLGQNSGITPGDLVGDWVRLYNYTSDGIDSMMPSTRAVGPPSGFSFTEDTVHYYFQGLEEIYDSISGRKAYIWLPAPSKYQVIKDTIFVSFTFTNRIAKYEVIRFDNDSLFLNYQDEPRCYKRISYTLDTNFVFDELVLSAEGFGGTLDILMDETGKVVFKGGPYATKKGYSEGLISRSDFKEIQHAFWRAEPSRLQSEYSYHVSHGEFMDITFLKNKKIVKTITDYGSVGPPYLEWALHAFRQIYKKIELDPIPDSLFAPFEYIWNFTCLSTKQEIQLKDSEHFFLVNELISGQQIEHKFRHKYLSRIRRWFYSSDDLESGSGALFKERPDLRKIKTDGRYFELIYRGKKTTIDIGYNFMENNMLLNKYDKSVSK